MYRLNDDLTFCFLPDLQLRQVAQWWVGASRCRVELGLAMVNWLPVRKLACPSCSFGWRTAVALSQSPAMGYASASRTLYGGGHGKVMEASLSTRTHSLAGRR